MTHYSTRTIHRNIAWKQFFMIFPIFNFYEFIEAESAGGHFADDYTMYEAEREGERVFMSIEMRDGVITLRETEAGDEDFEYVERRSDDRGWDSTLLTDEQYEALLDNTRVIDMK